MSVSKMQLYHLIDALPENEAEIAKVFLEFLLSKVNDPIVRVLANAPEDDEPLEEKEIDSIYEAQKDVKEGRTQTLNEMKREFGL